MKATNRENRKFEEWLKEGGEVFLRNTTFPLNLVLDWIEDEGVDIFELIPEEQIFDYVGQNLDQVDEWHLEQWANENGYVKKEEV